MVASTLLLLLRRQTKQWESSQTPQIRSRSLGREVHGMTPGQRRGTLPSTVAVRSWWRASPDRTALDAVQGPRTADAGEASTAAGPATAAGAALHDVDISIVSLHTRVTIQTISPLRIKYRLQLNRVCLSQSTFSAHSQSACHTRSLLRCMKKEQQQTRGTSAAGSRVLGSRQSRQRQKQHAHLGTAGTPAAALRWL